MKSALPSSTHILEVSEDLALASFVGRAEHVLDAGCGKGRMARELNRLGCSVDGIELSDVSAAFAEAYCRVVIRGSLTDRRVWSELGARQYDAIVFSHVLEHLVEPIDVLTLARDYLKPAGRFIIALPNVATWRMRLHLLNGNWTYTEEGILDRTHVKFYTLASARDLLRDAGLSIEREALLRRPAGGSATRQKIVRSIRNILPLASVEAFLFEARPLR